MFKRVPLHLAAMLVSVCLPFSLAAQSPAHTTIVVPAAAGGGADILARLFAQKMSPLLERPVVVENRPGANSAIGIAAVTRATPDGSTLLLVDRTTTVVNPLTLPNLPYDPEGLTPVSDVAQLDFLFVAGIDAPFATWEEMIAYARTNPGQVSVGSSGTGSGSHLSLELVARAVDAEFVHVPYKGMSPALQDVMGGVIDGLIAGPAVVMPQLQSGRIRLLAQGAETRLPQFSEVPTLAELGIHEPLLLPVTFTVFAPRGTPEPVIEALNQVLAQVAADPEIADRLAGMALQPLSNSPGEVERDSASLRERLSKVIEEIGLKD